MPDAKMVLQVSNLKKHFPVRRGPFRRAAGCVKAVDGVDFLLREGETLGLVGESGCGKTSVGRCIPRLIEPSAGRITFSGENGTVEILQADRDRLREIRRQIQIVFQDPYSSLDSRMLVRDVIAEPLLVNGVGRGRRQRTERVGELLEKVGLDSSRMNRYPHEFSGGERQRIAIARALALNPRLVICDEPVSALDVSVRAQVLNLLADLQAELGVTYLFVAHDLSVVAHVSDRVMVMYLGRIVETASSRRLYRQPRHPYTEALIGAIAAGDPRRSRTRRLLKGTVPDPSSPPAGCHFHPRCPYAQDRCRQESPAMAAVSDEPDHFVRCHFADTLDLAGYAG